MNIGKEISDKVYKRQTIDDRNTFETKMHCNTYMRFMYPIDYDDRFICLTKMS